MLSLTDGPLIDAPLYRFPIFGYFGLAVAAAASGNAQAAIDDLLNLAVPKVTFGPRRTLGEKSTTQAAVAQAAAALRAARALFYAAIEDSWAAANTGGTVTVDLRTSLRLAATHAARTSADIVRSMYDLSGGSAIYDDSPLQRRFRDATHRHRPHTGEPGHLGNHRPYSARRPNRRESTVIRRRSSARRDRGLVALHDPAEGTPGNCLYPRSMQLPGRAWIEPHWAYCSSNPNTWEDLTG